MTSSHEDSTLALRLAQPDDALAIRRLAALDDAPPLARPVLVAFVDGQPVAAASLVDERTVANPFLPTADVVALLSLRARQLRRRGTARRPATLRHPWRVPRLRAA
jgi:hypothetical protein